MEKIEGEKIASITPFIRAAFGSRRFFFPLFPFSANCRLLEKQIARRHRITMCSSITLPSPRPLSNYSKTFNDSRTDIMLYAAQVQNAAIHGDETRDRDSCAIRTHGARATTTYCFSIFYFFFHFTAVQRTALLLLLFSQKKKKVFLFVKKHDDSDRTVAACILVLCSVPSAEDRITRNHRARRGRVCEIKKN